MTLAIAILAYVALVLLVARVCGANSRLGRKLGIAN